MSLSILAHGGQITGDEMAIIGGGLTFALLFPVAALVFVARRHPNREDSDDGDGADTPDASTFPSESDLSVPAVSDTAERM